MAVVHRAPAVMHHLLGTCAPSFTVFLHFFGGIFIKAFPTILSEMDSWFACHPKPERLFQHNLIKNNQNQPVILDIEYAGWSSAKKRFSLDMLGLYKTNGKYKLIIFENKFGNGAIGGKAGISKHYSDIVDILSNPDSKKEVIASVSHIAANKVELGLLTGPFNIDSDVGIEILFLMAGFNMKSQALSNEVRKMHASIPARICFQDIGDTVIDYGRTEDLFK